MLYGYISKSKQFYINRGNGWILVLCKFGRGKCGDDCPLFGNVVEKDYLPTFEGKKEGYTIEICQKTVLNFDVFIDDREIDKNPFISLEEIKD